MDYTYGTVHAIDETITQAEVRMKKEVLAQAFFFFFGYLAVDV